MKVERVEGLVGKGQLLTATGDQRDPSGHGPLGNVVPALSQHVEREVDADHVRPGAPGDLQRDTGRPAGDVEHQAGLLRDDVVDHCPPPTAVLSHRQHLGQAVVTCRERGEETLGEPVEVARGLGLHSASSDVRISP